MDTLVIAQRADWLQSYLHCWPPAAESQRGTKWPTAKIWLSNEVFFRACLFFGNYKNPPPRETLLQSSQALYSLKFNMFWMLHSEHLDSVKDFVLFMEH